FFFSSRRRHTSFSRDWSSDVCSSDLIASLIAGKLLHSGRDWNAVLGFHLSNGLIASFRTRSASSVDILGHVVVINSQTASSFGKIGRASCRERVQTAVAGLPSETTDR